MPHYEAKLTSKGQITIPVEVRDSLCLKAGDRVDFYVEAGSRVVRIMARNAKMSDLFGVLSLPKGAKPLTPAAMDEAIGAHLAEKDERIKQSWNEWREFEEWRKRRKARAAE